MQSPLDAAKLVLALSLCLATPAMAAPGYLLSKIAVEGDAAPGTADSFGAFLDVTLDDSGNVAFGVPMASGFPAAGVWVDPGSGPELRMRDGDPPPAPIPGSYIGFGAFVRLDGTGRLATSAVVNTGGSGLSGLFLDTAGTDSALVVEGDAAPTPPAGTLDAGLGDIGFFGVNGAGDIAFVSDVIAGTAATGVFTRSAAGVLTLMAKDGDLVGGGPDAFQGFSHPALNDSGDLAFSAALTGGASTTGLFLSTGSGPVGLAFDGDPAPDTGGGSLVDFIYPALNAGGDVAFLSNVSGGSATGGLFLAESVGLSAIVVENQVVPGAGPVTTVGSIPDLSDDGRLAMSLGFASGPVGAGVYVYDAGSFGPVALDGEAAPASGGADFASFGFVSRNESGQVAFVATLDDGRTGAFLATPAGTPQVPMLPLSALPVTALMLVISARRSLRRG